tara:strand:+ start:3521 stop:4516 length:996 start_codon:yes stop_codon:yes gene_type:complete
MDLYFLEKSIPFNGNDLNSALIGGTEKVLINIANELAKKPNFNVKVFNQTKTNVEVNKVNWININSCHNYKSPDVLISFSDMNLFKNFKCNKNFLWSHSVQNLEKFIRKKQLIPYLLYRPTIILEGDYHLKKRSIITSIFGKHIIKLAPDYEFINEEININELPSKKCIFTTKSDRNLDFLINAWRQIYSLNKDAELYVNPPYNISEDLVNLKIKLRNKGSKNNLINDLKTSMIMLVPGHKGEVFCLAAEEARELCLPIVTMGYGSLYERVEHNKTGYIAKNIDEFVHYSHKLLNDKDLYLKFRSYLFSLRNSRNYSHVANELINLITQNK